VVIYDRLFVAGTFREIARRRLPLYVLLAATWMILALLVLEGPRSGSVGFELSPDMTWWDYARTQTWALVQYLKLAFWPTDLSLVYPTKARPLDQIWTHGLLVLSLLGATVAGLVFRPMWGFLGAWFFLILGPTSSVLPIITEVIAEHRMYLPLAGIIAGVVCAAYLLGEWLIQRSSAGARSAAVKVLTVTVGVGLAASATVMLGALTYQRNNQYRTTLSIWEDAIAKHPDNPQALNVGGCYMQDVGRTDEAMANLLKAVELRPDYADAHNNLGTIYYARGQMEKAGEHFSIATKLMPDFEYLGNLAMYYSKTGQTELAIEYYQKALEREPRSPHLHNGLASLLIGKGQFEQALVHCEKAIELDDNYAEAHNNMGALMMKMGHLDQALECFDRALKINNKFTIAQINQGEVLMALGRFEEAARCFQIAIRQDSRSVNAHIQLGNAYLRMGKTDQAVSMFKTAIEIEPSNGLAHARLADSMATRGLFAQAMPYYLRAMELGFSSPELYSNMGVALEANGRLLDAREAYQQAISMAPDWAQAHYCMGLLLEKLDMPDEAISHLRTALQLEPQHKQAQENLHRMEQGIAPPDLAQ